LSPAALKDEHGNTGIGQPVFDQAESRSEQKKITELPLGKDEDVAWSHYH